MNASQACFIILHPLVFNNCTIFHYMDVTSLTFHLHASAGVPYFLHASLWVAALSKDSFVWEGSAARE